MEALLAAPSSAARRSMTSCANCVNLISTGRGAASGRTVNATCSGRRRVGSMRLEHADANTISSCKRISAS
jgi:hypothetical protein